MCATRSSSNSNALSGRYQRGIAELATAVLNYIIALGPGAEGWGGNSLRTWYNTHVPGHHVLAAVTVKNEEFSFCFCATLGAGNRRVWWHARHTPDIPSPRAPHNTPVYSGNTGYVPGYHVLAAVTAVKNEELPF